MATKMGIAMRRYEVTDAQDALKATRDLIVHHYRRRVLVCIYNATEGPDMGFALLDVETKALWKLDARFDGSGAAFGGLVGLLSFFGLWTACEEEVREAELAVWAANTLDAVRFGRRHAVQSSASAPSYGGLRAGFIADAGPLPEPEPADMGGRAWS